MLWKKEQVETAMKILGKYSRVCDALPEIEKAVSRKVTVSSLKHAMKQRGADAPSYYLQRDLVGDAARKAENAWIRNIDQSVMDEIIRPVDGLNSSPKFTVKPFPYEIKSLGIRDIFKIPDIYQEIVYGEKITKIMVCPDAHHPYVDKKAWTTFLAACRSVKPDVLVIIGDFADVLSLSAHQKSPKDNTNFKSELQAINNALDEVSALNIPRVVFCAGNHCHRIDRYIAAKAPELDGMMNVYDLLKLKDRKFEYVPYGEFIRIGQMAFTHDVGRCGINAARQSLQDFGDNLVFGHSHRAQIVYGGTVEGKTHVCMNVGWLGDYEEINYRNRPTAKREWQHSFGLIHQDSAGVSYCNLIPIINGSCIVEGKIVRG